MNRKHRLFIFLPAVLLMIFSQQSFAKPTPSRQYYEIDIYHAANDTQFQLVNEYLKNAFIPFMNKEGIFPIGVFTEVSPADSGDHKIYVLIPYQSLQQWEALPARLYASTAFQQAAAGYWEAPADKPPYTRMEKILLRAFPDHPVISIPKLQNPKSERIYELRSYESPDEKFGLNKINMFNEGGEISIFRKLHFNAVFYAQVLSGSHMPNLMYMTTFEDMDSRNDHWKAFGNDPLWKKISGMKKYQGNVSKAVIVFLHPADYSEL
jgi:NIPSNAP